MPDYKSLIQNNSDKEFVIHVKTEEEMYALASVLDELGYTYAVPEGRISDIARDFAIDYGFDGCWRVSRSRGVAYNPSVEHWRFFTSDIIETRNGRFAFNDGYTDPKDAEIEADKLRYAFFEDDDSIYALRLFGLIGASHEQIEQFIAEKTAVKK